MSAHPKKFGPEITQIFFLQEHTSLLLGDYAELARIGHVSRARVTQIMNLNFLAPDIQEDLLFLPRVERGRDPIREHAIRPIAAMFDWRKQRKEWRKFASHRRG